MPCDDLDVGRDAPEGGYICILVADSHCCTADINPVLKAIILQLKLNLKDNKTKIQIDNRKKKKRRRRNGLQSAQQAAHHSFVK